MLIRSIRAENFRRFERVEVERLPTHGLIGIEGPNESGKSTLGEMLLFALFGRARGEIDLPVSSLIRWGAESLRVEVEFLVRSPKREADSEPSAAVALSVDALSDETLSGEKSGDSEYMIYREIDRRGSSLVKVLRLPGREAVAVGAIDVQSFIEREIRFDFEEFQRSFYHGQLEKRRWADKAARSEEVDFLELATGISYLRTAIRNARATSREHEERFAQVQIELDRHRTQIEMHDRNVQKIPALTEKLGNLESRIAETNSLVSSGREESGELRAEAKRLERRAVAMTTAADGAVRGLVDAVGKALEEDRAACGNRGGIQSQPPWESALQKSRDAIAKVDVFVREFLDLRSRIEEAAEEVAEEVAEQVAPGAKEGVPVEYQRSEGATERLGDRLRRLRVLSMILLLLTVMAGGASVAIWRGILTLEPDLYRTATGVSGAVTGVVLVLSAWCLARASAAKRDLEDHRSALGAARTQLDALRAEQQSLASLLETVAVKDVRVVVERACGLGDKRVRKRAEEFRDRHEGLLEKDGARRLESVLAEVAKLDRDLKGRLLDAAHKAKKKLSGSDATQKKLVSDRDRVASELRECRSQEKKKLALQETNLGVEVAAKAARADIATVRQAIDLLEEAIVSIRARVRPALVSYLKTVLPRLTSGRYRDLKVEDSLEIKVFSSAKGDFLAVSELSGGTGEALGLSLRLALSQAFVMARIGQEQFIFLDEPFKMMDGARSIATLCALEELSAELRQVFVAQPKFDDAERDRCRYLIRTDGDSERLRAVPRSSEATSTGVECFEPEARAPEVDKPEVDDPGGDDPEVDRPEIDNSEVDDPEIGAVRFDESLGSAASSFSEHPSPPMPPALTGAPDSDARRDESAEHDSDDAIGAEPRAQRQGQDASK